MNFKGILDFLKSHWISLTSGVVTLAAIGVLVLGMMRTSVVDEMKKRVAAAGEIDSLKADPKNEASIQAEAERLEKFKQQYAAALAVAESINQRKPLLEQVFPKPTSNAVAYEFQDAYRQRFYQLPREMNASGPPTPQEVQDELEAMIEEKKRKGGDEAEPPPSVQPKPEPPGKGPPVPPGPGPAPALPTPPGAHATGTGGLGDKYGVSPDEAARQAAIRKAHSIQMYCEVTGPHGAFQISPIAQMSDVPKAADMWFAQVGLWIQEDVVKAIHEVNAEAAAKLDPKDAHVGRMPIKHLVAIRVLGYLGKAGTNVKFEGVREGSSTGQNPPSPIPVGDFPPVFTGHVGDDQFDVLRFTVTAVVDQRDLLKLPDRVTRTNFYQLVSLSYDSQPPFGADAREFYYGDDPVVRATYEFEGFMERGIFQSMMPPDVRQLLDAKPAGK